jgi:hypothetical protein
MASNLKQFLWHGVSNEKGKDVKYGTWNINSARNMINAYNI